MENCMNNKYFSNEEVKVLSNNQYVKSVSTKAITYTNDFKILFVVHREKGEFPRDIFEECGFDAEVMGIARIRNAARRWSYAYENKGVTGLEDKRGITGRPMLHEITLDEKIARLEAQNLLLRAENELLKNIQLEERRLIKTEK
jgi:transposase